MSEILLMIILPQSDFEKQRSAKLLSILSSQTPGNGWVERNSQILSTVLRSGASLFFADEKAFKRSVKPFVSEL